jgi:8-oxo-dGTP diphosphatase
MRKERFKYICSAYLFLIKNDEILLLRRANTGFMDGMYGLPAGHMDGNETAREAGARESLEEINVNIEPSDLEICHVMHRKTEPEERIDFFMTTKRYTGEIKNAEPEKCDDLRWFPLSKLPDNIIPYIKEALTNFQKGRFYSEWGW